MHVCNMHTQSTFIKENMEQYQPGRHRLLVQEPEIIIDFCSNSPCNFGWFDTLAGFTQKRYIRFHRDKILPKPTTGRELL